MHFVARNGEVVLAHGTFAVACDGIAAAVGDVEHCAAFWADGFAHDAIDIQAHLRIDLVGTSQIERRKRRAFEMAKNHHATIAQVLICIFWFDKCSHAAIHIQLWCIVQNVELEIHFCRWNGGRSLIFTPCEYRCQQQREHYVADFFQSIGKSFVR